MQPLKPKLSFSKLGLLKKPQPVEGVKRYGAFELRIDGVYEIGKKDEASGVQKRTFVCSWLEVPAKTRDQNGKEWGYLLRWKDSDGGVHEWSVPASHLVKSGTEVVEVLAGGGLTVAHGAVQRVKKYILAVNPTRKVTNVPRPGWHTVKGPAGKEYRLFVSRAK